MVASIIGSEGERGPASFFEYDLKEPLHAWFFSFLIGGLCLLGDIWAKSSSLSVLAAIALYQSGFRIRHAQIKI
ncbi:MAG TPA: hypothetical protein DD384_02180 [Firmicutes bacterium]|nr:hypothetical protein [Bacillota bacterium]